MAAIASIYLDIRVSKQKKANNDKEKTSGKEVLFPVKIRITYDRERRYYGLEAKKVNDMLKGYQAEKYCFDGLGNFSITKDVFEAATDKAPRGVYRELNDIFKKIVFEYQEKIDNISPFSFDAFALEFDKHNPENNVFKMFERKIDQLEKEDRIGSASAYRCSMNSLKEFTKKENLPFEYFSVSTLRRYESWMKGKGKSTTTIGIYLRSFRALFNETVNSGITKYYPFGKNGYNIPKSKGRKIALDTNEIKQLFGLQPQNDGTSLFYFDIWKLSFLLNGINIKDLVLLKQKNISGEFIYFIREKTKNTAKEQSEIKVYLSDDAKSIIDKWKTDSKSEYLLPFLTGNETQKELKKKVNILVSLINQTMKRMALQANIMKDISCYTARHSWATQMMRHGAPVSFIGKQLGHTNTATTDAYLNSFEDDVIIQWQKRLTEFKV